MRVLKFNQEKTMLRKFRVKNYKCFENDIEIDFTKVNEYKFNEQCITSNNLLKDIIIFGHNGSGKSNFGFAIFDIVMTLTDRHVEKQLYDELSFLNFNTDLPYAEFEYEFEFDSNIVKYIYRKKTPTIILAEEFSINGNILYKTDEKTRKISGDLENLDAFSPIKQNYRWDIPFQRYITNNVSWEESSPVRKMMDFVNRMLWFRSLKENAYIGLKTEIVNLSQWIVDNNKVEDFQKFLKSYAGLDIQLQAAEIQGPIKQNFLLQVGKKKGIMFENVASTGTNSLMVLFYWKQYIKDASFVFIDEFDAFYHFELSKQVVKMFIDIPDMQTIFTSHNTYLASNDLMRPDCYLTLSKGELKSFKERTNRELREGNSLERLLRSGEFDD